jgi:hypothetical protein
MALFPFADRHRKAAEELYIHRSRLLARGTCDATALIALEGRLMVHLHVLARLGVQKLDGQGRDDARFVDYAVALQTNDPAVVESACRLAIEQLGDPALSATPILDAFVLYPPDNALLIEQYRTRPEAGAPLFTLWRRQGAALPTELVNQAELQPQDAALQHRALAYAADQPAYGSDRFRPYYAGLLEQTPGEPPPARLLIPALRGGLLRGDPEAAPALRRALAQIEAPANQLRLLCLLALNGDRADLPVLHEHYRQSPAQGLRLLALTGLVESIPSLLDSLGRPDLSEASTGAWTWLTGVTLPQRPHLMLVDDQGGSRAPDHQDGAAMKQVPDRATAEAWWQSHAPAWGDERRIAGAPLEATWLIQLARERVGDALADLLDLLALHLKRPLGITPWGWTAPRRQRLQALETPPATPSAGAARS